MPTIEGTRALKTVQGEYDFAIDGGAISTIAMRAAANDPLGCTVPAGGVVEGGYIEIDTLLASGGAATVGVNLEAAGDVFGPITVAGAPWSTTGRKSIISAFTGATTLKTTVPRALTITVAAFVLTAGKFRVVLYYR